MASWMVIPCLSRLFTDFNVLAPGRDKASDGAKGDSAHASSVSDHNPDETGTVPVRDADSLNEVHAIDVDADLRESDLTMEKVVQFLLGRCRSGAEKRLRYIIYNRRIWSASSNWVQKTYTGSNAHDKHAHFSASYTTSHEANTASWRLEDIPVALSQADKDFITDAVEKEGARVEQELKTYVEARVGDVVPRWDANGNLITDPANPNIRLLTAARDIGQATARIERKVEALNTEPTPSA